jgi:hypothetical protein
MKLRIWQLALLTLVLSGASLAAQDERYSTSLEVNEHGQPILKITNLHSFPITGFLLTVNPNGQRSTRKNEIDDVFFDIYVEYRREKPIAPQESFSSGFPHFEGTPLAELAPQVRAVIFSDGTTAGEPAWVNRVLRRRARLLTQLTAMLNTIREARTQKQEAVKLAEDLQARRDEVDKPQPPEGRDFQYIDGKVLGVVIRYMRGGILMNGVPPKNDDLLYRRMIQQLEGWRDYVRLANPVATIPALAKSGRTGGHPFHDSGK